MLRELNLEIYLHTRDSTPDLNRGTESNRTIIQSGVWGVHFKLGYF